MARGTMPELPATIQFSPHTRGWPVWQEPSGSMAPVLPAHAGMARQDSMAGSQGLSFSPHTRGWPGPRSLLSSVVVVLPAHAGMARPRGWYQRWRGRSPRTRGDGPKMQRATAKKRSFSPHTRGWPAIVNRIKRQRPRSPRTRGDGPTSGVTVAMGSGVLPAHAGMALGPPCVWRHQRTFSPHTRGWPGNDMHSAQ